MHTLSNYDKQTLIELSKRGISFAFNTLKLLDNNNNVVSPFSIIQVLMLAMNATNGTSQEEIRKLLNVSNYSLSELNISYFNILKMLTERTRRDKISIANLILNKEGFNLLPEYKSLCKEIYEANISTLDNAQQINSWCSQKTNGQINNIITDEELAQTICTFLNATSFEAKWYSEFNAENNILLPFTDINGIEKKIVMMSADMGRYGYFFNDEVFILELPYRNYDSSMILFMPNYSNGYNLNSLIGSLTFERWDNWRNHMEYSEFDELRIPKFKIEKQINLKNTLNTLGVNDIFNPCADFSGMTTNKLFVDNIIQKACIEVNEEGTKAAAVTMMSMDSCIPDKAPKPRLVINRPFMYFIIDNNTDSILFIGKIVDSNCMETTIKELPNQFSELL